METNKQGAESTYKTTCHTYLSTFTEILISEYIYYNLCLHGAGRNDFDAGKPITRATEKWALKIENFLGPKIAKSEANAIWAPCNGFPRIQISKPKRQIRNKYTGNFMYECRSLSF
jgi:hypothetical protein